ncbi:protein kinase [candidate division KSB1 bacterium]|nr:protein kinase [candidate division KSB1 bacterium]
MDKIIDGRYEIQETIDDLGMFKVYKALDKNENNIVIVKVLKDEYANKEEIVNKFHQYFLTYHGVRPLTNLVKVKSFAGNVGSSVYQVQEFVDGMTIKDYLTSVQTGHEELARIFKEICSGLHYLHLKNLCHYKVTPNNIMVSRDKNIVKLVGLGSLYLALGDKKLLDSLIAKDKEFVAPEIQSGTDASGITAACDVFSLGKVIQSLPVKTDKNILEKAIDKNPAKRYTAIRDFLGQCDLLFKGSDGPVSPPPPPPPPKEDITFMPMEDVVLKPNSPIPQGFVLPIKKEDKSRIKKVECLNPPDFSAFDSDTLEFKWKPDTSHQGSHVIKFRITTEKGSQELDMPITVKKPGIGLKTPTQPRPESEAGKPEHGYKEPEVKIPPKPKPKPKIIKPVKVKEAFDFKPYIKAFTWIYNIILLFAGAFAVVLFIDDLALGFLALGILEAVYLLICGSSEKFQKMLE